jgi:hypothetical protein
MARPRAMVSMEIDDESRFDLQPLAVGMPVDKFPYGLRLSLDEGVLNKLECDQDDFQMDGLIHLHALARVTALGPKQTIKLPDGRTRITQRVELQIEDMSIECEDDENEEEEAEERHARP